MRLKLDDLYSLKSESKSFFNQLPSYNPESVHNSSDLEYVARVNKYINNLSLSFRDRWEMWLTQEQKINWTALNADSKYSYSSDYFSLPTMLDLFGTKNDESNLIQYYEIFNENMSAFLNDMVRTLENEELYTSLGISINNKNEFVLDWAIIGNSEWAKVMSSEITKITEIKNTYNCEMMEMVIEARSFKPYEDDYMYDKIIKEMGWEDDFAPTEENNSLSEQLSTPDFKLYYPEPYVASPSFVHEDLWFMHILHFQHWLWFMFISLIMFYFITFINVVRWCNMRTKPKRETRGVSRSKCADLITACVPVSWAISIIVSETVDATDYYDGFGTGEIIVGIRAYQWGWEYFYPKGIDLHYNVTPSFSSVVGNSLKYNTSPSKMVSSNTLWKSYQMKKTNNISVSPAHIVLAPSDKLNILNFSNFSEVGTSTYAPETVFKKVQLFFKKANINPAEKKLTFMNNYSLEESLFKNEGQINNNYSFGTQRQHNLMSSKALFNNCNSLLDQTSFDKMVKYSSSLDFNNSKFEDNLSLGFENKYEQTLGSGVLNALNIISGSSSDSKFNDFVNYPSRTNSIMFDTDTKKKKSPYRFILRPFTKSKSKHFSMLLSNDELSNSFVKSDVEVFSDNSNLSNPAYSSLNKGTSYSAKSLKSPTLDVSKVNSNPRLIENTSSKKTSHNFNAPNTNNITSLINNNFNMSSTNNISNIHGSIVTDWVNPNSLNRSMSNNIVWPQGHSPVPVKSWTSSALANSRLDHDEFTPEIFEGSDEYAPSQTFATQWLTNWATSNSNHRLVNANKVSNLLNSSFLPISPDYKDYDFRSWQAAEVLEDSFWEGSYSIYGQDDLMNSFDSAADYEEIKKRHKRYVRANRDKKIGEGIILDPFIKDVNCGETTHASSMFLENPISDANYLPHFNFMPFWGDVLLEESEESFENTKYLNMFQSKAYRNVLNTNLAFTHPINYTYVIDNFQESFDDTLVNSNQSENNVYINDSELDLGSDQRLTNKISLRKPAKSGIAMFNAIQKVFKTRFDEGRCHARLQDFANSANKLPFITAPKVSYNSMLGKNKNSFYSADYYNRNLIKSFSVTYPLLSSLNSYVSDLPFLVSMRSDPIRYLWFDWQSRWSSIEVQPSSVARYSLIGVPYTNKSFEYSTKVSDNIAESENYLNRLSRARKNYLSNWTFTPYLFERTTNWSNHGNVSNNLFVNKSLRGTKIMLKNTLSSLNKLASRNSFTDKSTPSYSGVNTPGRSAWRPMYSTQSYNYSSSVFVDLMSKREFLYKQYFTNKGLGANLPKYLTSNPNNPMFEELKNSFSFTDPINISSEYNRDVVYSNTFLSKYSIMKFLTYTDRCPNSIHKTLTKYLYSWFFMVKGTERDLFENKTLYKNQYRPMRKGITNMIRLHATGAIAMPIEIRLHILASSRDVIHSWAIPSAGIKIDCVPGYSSHRVTIFLVSGIFWGQCMEICGRFHHWMPIVVYFMKRDLFFLWCTHFMHYSKSQSTFNMTDKQLTDQIRLVSYDKSSWLNEINSKL